jgi:hypothetical protein
MLALHCCQIWTQPESSGCPLTIGVFRQKVLGTHDRDFQGVCGGLQTDRCWGSLWTRQLQHECDDTPLSLPHQYCSWSASARPGELPSYLGLLHARNGISVFLRVGAKHLWMVGGRSPGELWRKAGHCSGHLKSAPVERPASNLKGMQEWGINLFLCHVT